MLCYDYDWDSQYDLRLPYNWCLTNPLTWDLDMPEQLPRDNDPGTNVTVLTFRVERLEVDMSEVKNTVKALSESTANLAGTIKVIVALALAANGIVLSFVISKLAGWL